MQEPQFLTKTKVGWTCSSCDGCTTCQTCVTCGACVACGFCADADLASGAVKVGAVGLIGYAVSATGVACWF